MQDSTGPRIAHQFVQGLQVSDPRYDLWVYGAFLVEVPRRIGANAALDAAAESFSTALPVLRTKVVCEDMRAKYIDALAALRTTLNSPTLASSSCTLCAIFLLVITQYYLGIRGTQTASHSNGILQVIRYASMNEAKSEFDLGLLKAMCFDVIFDGLFNPAIEPDEHFYQLIESWEIRRLEVPVQQLSITQHNKMSRPIDSLSLRNLARLLPSVHRPSLHNTELRSTYQMALRDLATVRDRVKIAQRMLDRKRDTEASAEVKCLILHQTMHGLLLAVSLLVNGILRALGQSTSLLAAESTQLTQEVLDLATACCRYRPLGASYIPLCLLVACAVSEAEDLRPRLAELLEDWQADFSAKGYLEGVGWLRTRLRDIRYGREDVLVEGYD